MSKDTKAHGGKYLNSLFEHEINGENEGKRKREKKEPNTLTIKERRGD